MTRPRAADDFATIRARIEELRREREAARATENEVERDLSIRRARTLRWPPTEPITGPGRLRQSGPMRS